MLSVTISASKSFGGVVLHAEFQRDTGRLRTGGGGRNRRTVAAPLLVRHRIDCWL